MLIWDVNVFSAETVSSMSASRGGSALITEHKEHEHEYFHASVIIATKQYSAREHT